MRQVERSALVPYPAEAMFDPVADVESYPAFLPGCTAARVRAGDNGEVIGTVALAQGPLSMEFTTRNELERPAAIRMTLLDGPFRELQGAWEFRPLGNDGCRVSLRLRFAFRNAATDLLLGPFFESVCNRLVDAFVGRARALAR